jgi:hypothetical protein
MKLLEQLLNHEDKPVQLGQALHFERPVWLVTCALKRPEPFGVVSTEASYEVAAGSEAEARSSVRSYVMHSRPQDTIRSIQARRQPRR